MAYVKCPVCRGSGRSGRGRCHTCNGNGERIVDDNDPRAKYQLKLAEEAKKKELDQPGKPAEQPPDPKE